MAKRNINELTDEEKHELLLKLLDWKNTDVAYMYEGPSDDNYKKKWCEECQEETAHESEFIKQRWENDSIPDEDLTECEVISRINDDVPYSITCSKCGNSWEEL